MPSSPRSHREYLIDQIMPVREVHLLAGPSGAGKTTLLMQIIGELLRGDPIFTFKSFPSPVFYLSCDRTLEEQLRVMDRTGLAHGTFPIAVLEQIFAYTADPTIEGVLTYVQSHAPSTKLLVIDGFATLVPSGKLSDYSIVSKFLRKCQFLCQKLDITILGVVHFSKEKGSKDDGYANPREKILGSTAWSGFANLIITLEKAAPDDPSNMIRNLWICSRNLPEQKLRMRMDEASRIVQCIELDDDEAYMILGDEIKAQIPLEKIFSRKDVLEINSLLPAPAPFADITVDRFLSRALLDGWLEKPMRGRYKRVAEA